MLFETIKPQSLTLHHKAFNDAHYLFELKYDGFRILLHKEGERIEAYTRQGRCITDKFPELQQVQKQIHAHTAILDCEGVVFRGGRPVFDDFAYRGRLKQPLRIEQATPTHPATFVAFDVLMSDGKDHTKEQLLTRKEHLGKIVEPSNELITTFYVDGEGVDLKRLSEESDWEGIVAKRKNSVYQQNVRSTDWLKIKNWREIDVVILGYRTDPEFGMIVGLNFPTVRNKPVASVQYGFSRDEKLAFLNVAQGLHTVKERGIQWIEPVLCCRIQYLERTDLHYLRMVSFKRFLFERQPQDCKWVG